MGWLMVVNVEQEDRNFIMHVTRSYSFIVFGLRVHAAKEFRPTET